MSAPVQQHSDSPAPVNVRSGAIDFLRVVGITAVVAGHVWSTEATHAAFYTWHVPLFFFLSGYLWTDGRSMRAEYVKRFKTVARPYLFWLAVILMFSIVWGFLEGGVTAGRVLGPIWGGELATRPFTAFWFVTALFFGALLYRLIERLPNAARWAVILAGVVAAFTIGDLLSRTPLAIGSAWPCLSFIAAGAELRKVRSRIDRPALVGVALLVVSAVLVLPESSAPLDIKNGDYGTPVLSVLVACAISAGMLLISQPVFDALPPTFSRAFIWLSAAGFVVVLTHAVPLQIMGTTAEGGTLDLAAALVIPWIIGLLIVRTPLAPWAAGTDRPRRGGKALDIPSSRGTEQRG